MSTSSFKTRSVVATAEQKRIVSPSNEGASGQSSTIQDCCQKVPEPPSFEGFSVDIEMTNADLLRLTGEQPIAFHRCFARCFGVNAGLLLGYLLKWRGANDEVYRTEKARGVAVEDDPGFGRWMLDRDFSANTKMTLRKIFDDIENSWRKRHAETVAPESDGLPF